MATSQTFTAHHYNLLAGSDVSVCLPPGFVKLEHTKDKQVGINHQGDPTARILCSQCEKPLACDPDQPPQYACAIVPSAHSTLPFLRTEADDHTLCIFEGTSFLHGVQFTTTGTEICVNLSRFLNEEDYRRKRQLPFGASRPVVDHADWLADCASGHGSFHYSIFAVMQHRGHWCIVMDDFRKRPTPSDQLPVQLVRVIVPLRTIQGKLLDLYHRSYGDDPQYIKPTDHIFTPSSEEMRRCGVSLFTEPKAAMKLDVSTLLSAFVAAFPDEPTAPDDDQHCQCFYDQESHGYA